MNIAVVGSSGYIAGYLLKSMRDGNTVKKLIRIGRNTAADIFLDLLEAENFDYEILSDIDYIIFSAAISGPDQCANDYDRCWKTNVEGTRYFIGRALEKECRVIFFSSDAVFGDISGCIYRENSPTEPKTAYGKMKKAVEDTYLNERKFKAIRLSYVVSRNDKFVAYCLECMKKGVPIEVFHPFYRSCITVSDVVRTVHWLIHHWEELDSPVLNLAGRELVSRVRIVDELGRCFHQKLSYRIITPDAAFYRNRPAITQMESIYIDRYGIIDDCSFTTKIKKELEEHIHE